jgi:hypothetical protein
MTRLTAWMLALTDAWLRTEVNASRPARKVGATTRTLGEAAETPHLLRPPAHNLAMMHTFAHATHTAVLIRSFSQTNRRRGHTLHALLAGPTYLRVVTNVSVLHQRPSVATLNTHLTHTFTHPASLLGQGKILHVPKVHLE